MTIGVPIKLLHEAQGHIISLELKTGQLYRGKLLEAEDNMNIQLRDITVTARDGRVSQLDQNAPMFKGAGPGGLKGRGIGLGRGRATVARAQQARGRGGRGGFRGGRGGPPPRF
ncbi:unnamed protein product [Mucor hiemalis]